jgi:aspartokinase
VHRPHPTTHEVVDPLRSVLLRVSRSRALNDFIKAETLGLVEVVVVVAIVEAVTDLFVTLAQLISEQSHEL